MIHSHSQQISSANLLSGFSQQIFSADLLSRSSQQIFSADLLSRFSQQIFSADFLSRSSQQIFSADLLSYHVAVVRGWWSAIVWSLAVVRGSWSAIVWSAIVLSFAVVRGWWSAIVLSFAVVRGWWSAIVLSCWWSILHEFFRRTLSRSFREKNWKWKSVGWLTSKIIVIRKGPKIVLVYWILWCFLIGSTVKKSWSYILNVLGLSLLFIYFVSNVSVDSLVRLDLKICTRVTSDCFELGWMYLCNMLVVGWNFSEMNWLWWKNVSENDTATIINLERWKWNGNWIWTLILTCEMRKKDLPPDILLHHRVGQQDHLNYGYMGAVQGCLVCAIRHYVPEGSRRPPLRQFAPIK